VCTSQELKEKVLGYNPIILLQNANGNTGPVVSVLA
jgi:hypothetical protein